MPRTAPLTMPYSMICLVQLFSPNVCIVRLTDEMDDGAYRCEHGEVPTKNKLETTVVPAQPDTNILAELIEPRVFLGVTGHDNRLEIGLALFFGLSDRQRQHVLNRTLMLLPWRQVALIWHA